MTTPDTFIPPAIAPAQVMTEYLAAAKTGDWEAAYSYFADDMVVRIPGSLRVRRGAPRPRCRD
jgi:hypothetical protein